MPASRFDSQLAQLVAHQGATTAASTVHHQNLALSGFAESFPYKGIVLKHFQGDYLTRKGKQGAIALECELSALW